VSLQCFPCISSKLEVLEGECRRSFLGGFVAWAASGRRPGTLGGVVHELVNVVHGPIGRTLLNLPKILFACFIPFDVVFVGWVVKSGGGLSSGGIQFAKDIEMLPSVPQLTIRLLLLGLGCRCLYGGVMIGVVRCGVVIRGELKGLGDSASGRASQNPGLGSQAEEEGESSLRTANFFEIFFESSALCLGNGA
jgi:hypothetical protein